MTKDSQGESNQLGTMTENPVEACFIALFVGNVCGPRICAWPLLSELWWTLSQPLSHSSSNVPLSEGLLVEFLSLPAPKTIASPV